MSDGKEFQRSDAATGNVRRLTVVSRNLTSVGNSLNDFPNN